MRTTMLMAVLGCCCTFAQQSTVITGSVYEKGLNKPIANATIALKGNQQTTFTNASGSFELSTDLEGDYVLEVLAQDYLSKEFSLYLNGSALDLGTIYLERDIQFEKTDNLITLTDGDLLDDFESVSGAMGLLQSTRDVFLNRAAFDFGQAFFKVRGYDSRNGQVLINGVPMNKFFDGRPQWNHWGGLNDVTRNQEFTNGLTINPVAFGGILGNTNIDTRPSGMRPGIRISASSSNRTYRNRLMATFNSGKQENGLAYSISASRRWAEEGYVAGTLYDAYSFFGALEYQLNSVHSIAVTGLWARNRRGRSSALSDEVFQLMGNRYNPYWGNQDAKIRNAREREISEPIFMVNYTLKQEKFNVNAGVAYQTGINSRSRLGYYNAPNPDPTYYRYLPSYYINGSFGADFTNANLVKEAILENPQLSWESLYLANQNSGPKASYLLYDDLANDNTITISSTFGYELNDWIKLGWGGNYMSTSSENYAEIFDLLGASYHEDLDTFSNTLNDAQGNLQKITGDKFNYHYNLDTSKWEGFGQVEFTLPKWSGFVSAAYSTFETQRTGFFLNERYAENSWGEGDKVSFSNLAYKGGGSYFLSGRHWFTANAGYLERPPTLQNIFINPRENHGIVSDLQPETVTTVDLSYFVRLPNLTGRISAFYTRFQHATDINFFFTDTGLGSDFVQEVITGLDKLHKGIEFGFEYEASSSVKLTAAGNVGNYTYASDPMVQINFDTSSPEEDLISIEGYSDLGFAQLKGLKLAQGPQTALALGVEYRSPKYWWVGATTNYLTNNYINISTILRTQSFKIDPETGEKFPEATNENVAKLLAQNKMEDIYLLNLVGGKSWLLGGKYFSAFASVSNLFDSFFRTGGYEQSRNGNFGQMQQDNLSGTPSFGPKYWYGYGRTYFLNFAISF
ncbi:TonB-dependent receptor domain-containing protein [Flagellimonas sp. GZD32]|uniref:TonB-dependent receptor domain-containing protein n=1 Tax=Flagellimonas cixiensis TaxID=3228750 RepID=UPI0035C886F5